MADFFNSLLAGRMREAREFGRQPSPSG